MEIKVKIDNLKNFKQKFRNYKLDQLEGGKSNYEMEVFRNVMEQSGTRISDLPDEWAEISSKRGIIDGSDYGQDYDIEDLDDDELWDYL